MVRFFHGVTKLSYVLFTFLFKYVNDFSWVMQFYSFAFKPWHCYSPDTSYFWGASPTTVFIFSIPSILSVSVFFSNSISLVNSAMLDSLPHFIQHFVIVNYSHIFFELCKHVTITIFDFFVWKFFNVFSLGTIAIIMTLVMFSGIVVFPAVLASALRLENIACFVGWIFIFVQITFFQLTHVQCSRKH